MRKIINRKMYNTDTATEVASYNNGLTPNDYYYCEEHLFRKKTGEFFIYGSGGAGTIYAELLGQNCWRDEYDIFPLDDEAAQRWLE